MLDRLSKKKRNLALLALFALLGWFFWTIRSVLNPLILGYLLAFVLHPAVLHLQRDRNWSRRRAVNVIFLVAALFLGGTATGIYFQGRELVRDVVESEGEEEIFGRAEGRIDAFLERSRAWSRKWTGDGEQVLDGEDGIDGEVTPPSEPGTDTAVGADPSGEPAAGDTSAGDAQGAGETEAPAATAESTDAVAEGSESEVALTLRDLLRGAIKSYIGNTEGGAGAVALQNAPTAMLFVGKFFGSIFSLAGLLLLLPIYGYFLLFELERIHRFIRRHVPKDERERVTRIGTQIGEVIANFFRGRLLICVLKGLVITFGLMLAGVPYPLFFGVLAGFLSLVPFVGPMVAFLAALVFGLQDMNFVSAVLWVGATFLLGEFIEGYVLIPKVLGDSLGLHPVVVLVSVFAGGAAFGMFGLLIAIPATAALVILVRELVLPALRQFADEDSHFDVATEGAASEPKVSTPGDSAPAGPLATKPRRGRGGKSKI